MTEAPSRNGSRQKPELGEKGFASEADDLFGSDRFPYATEEAKPKDYEEMFDEDSQAHALQRAVVLPILDTPLEIEAAEGGEKEAEFCRDVLLKPLSEGGMTTPIENVVAQMVAGFWQKRVFFEIVWEVRDGKYVVKKLAHRPAQTCKIVPDKHGGFDGFEQEGYRQGRSVKERFGIGKAFVYVHRGGEKPLEGRSSFASVYKRYKHKKRVEWLFFDNLQTFTRGIRVATYGGESNEGAKILFENVTKVGGAGTVVLGKEDGLEVLRAPGVSAEYKEALNYLDSQMARALQAQWLLLGQGASNSGSWALSRDHSDFFLLGEEAARQEIAWHFTNYLLSLLVRYNFGENGKVPKAVFPPLSETAKTQALEVGRELMQRGQLTPKPGLLKGIEEKMAQALEIDAEKLEEEEEKAEDAPDDSPAPEGLQRAIGALQQIAGANGNGAPQQGGNVVPIRQEEDLDEDEVYALAEEFGVDPETVVELHLRTSRRKGSHNEKSHGTKAGFGADGPKAARGKRSEGGRRAATGKGDSEAPVQRLPRTGDEAADAVIQAFKDSGDERVKNDPAFQKKVRDNYKRKFGDDVDKADAGKRADLEAALAANRDNPRYARAAERFGQPAIIFKRDNPEEDISEAVAYQQGPVTVFLQPSKAYNDWAPRIGSISLGDSVVEESLSGTLRHEFGHHVENQIPDAQISEFIAALPDGQTLKGDLSYYAGIKWKRGRDHGEAFAELVSLVTSPGYDREKIPESIRPAARLVEGYLYGGGRV